MTTQTIDDIRAHLHRFETSVHDLRRQIHDPENPENFPASTPLVEKHLLAGLLQSPGLDDIIRQEFLCTYGQIVSDFTLLEQAGGKAYRDRLFYDLCSFTDRYGAAISFQELALCDPKKDRDLFMREEIGVLIRELESDHELTDIQRKIAALDEAMEQITRKTARRIIKKGVTDENGIRHSRLPSGCRSATEQE